MSKHSQAYMQILDCVRRAGRLMLKEEAPEIAVKGANDFVTARDREIQDFLIRELSGLFPSAFFFAEEKENFELPDTEGFIIDPIDGTTNFMNGFPCCAVCVARVRQRQLVDSFIYNPFREEMFTAEAGRGAWLNEQPLHVVSRPPSRAICLIEDSWKADRIVLRRFFASARCIGSAELGIAYVACGRAGVKISKLLHIWDYAAGTLIAREAGALVLDPDGQDAQLTEPGRVVVCCPSCRDAALQALREAEAAWKS